jgi:thymidylate synthase ThyX
VSINAESARYKELKEDKMYLPGDFRCSIEGNSWYNILQIHTKKSNHYYHQCLAELTPIIGRKRAKESARFFKTMNSQITMDISFNFRSFAHFCKLRNAKDAQLEIQGIAQQMLDLVKNIEGHPFEHTIKAFNLINN